MASERIPKLGQVAPDFALSNSEGQVHKLSELVDGGTLVLIFYRGHW